MTYSAPQTYSALQSYSAPQSPMNGMVTTSAVGSQSMASGVAMHGLPWYAPDVHTTTTPPSPSVTYPGPQTYSAPQICSVPQVPMNGMVTTSVVGSQSMSSGVAMHGLPGYAPDVVTRTITPSPFMTISTPRTYSAQHVPMNGIVTKSVVGSQSMASEYMANQSFASQSMASQAPQAPVPSHSLVAIVAHPPVTVTAKEFARINGTFVFEPSTFVFKKFPDFVFKKLPEKAGTETVCVETDQEVVVNDTEKRKSRCC